MSKPDIRVGDLVKATNVEDELTITGRVSRTGHDGAHLHGGYFTYYRNWRFELLDRPLPPIDEELLNNAINAWRKGYYGYRPTLDAARDPQYRKGISAVINYLREHDTYNKESK